LRVELPVPERLSATGAVHSKVPGQVQKCPSAARTLSAACPLLERDKDALERRVHAPRPRSLLFIEFDLSGVMSATVRVRAPWSKTRFVAGAILLAVLTHDH
jgi:hypothetical protein